jgi:hypothetical protein
MVASAFFLLSLLGYLKANAPASVHRNPARWTIFSICAYLLSLFAGPSGLLLPVILLIIDSYPLKRLAGQRSGLRSAAGRLIWQKAPYLSLSVAFGVLNIAARHYEPITQPAYQDDFFTWAISTGGSRVLSLESDPAHWLVASVRVDRIVRCRLCRSRGGHLCGSPAYPRQMASSSASLALLSGATFANIPQRISR